MHPYQRAEQLRRLGEELSIQVRLICSEAKLLHDRARVAITTSQIERYLRGHYYLVGRPRMSPTE